MSDREKPDFEGQIASTGDFSDAQKAELHWSLQRPETVLITAGGLTGGLLGARGGLGTAVAGTLAGVLVTVLIAAMGDESIPLGPHQ